MKCLMLLMSVFLISFLSADEDKKLKVNGSLKDALYLEIVEKNFDKALAIYEKILLEKKDNRRENAVAKLRKTICLLKTNQRENALELFENIVEEYEDLADISGEAANYLRLEEMMNPKERLERDIDELKDKRNQLIKLNKIEKANELDEEIIHLHFELRELEHAHEEDGFSEERRPDVRPSREKLRPDQIRERIQHLAAKRNDLMAAKKREAAENINREIRELEATLKRTHHQEERRVLQDLTLDELELKINQTKIDIKVCRESGREDKSERLHRYLQELEIAFKKKQEKALREDEKARKDEECKNEESL